MFTTKPLHYKGVHGRGARADSNLAMVELQAIISPTHKRTEGRAPLWGFEFTSNDATLQGGGPA